MTIGNYIKSHGLRPGMIITLDDGIDTKIVIGHATPYIQPTTLDGEIGWFHNEGYGLMKIKNIEFIDLSPDITVPDFRELTEVPEINGVSKVCDICGFGEYMT